MDERPAAPGRRSAPEGRQETARRNAGARDVEGLSRAQTRALARSAPLTPAEFRARRRVAEEGLISLRALLDDSATAGDPGST